MKFQVPDSQKFHNLKPYVQVFLHILFARESQVLIIGDASCLIMCKKNLMVQQQLWLKAKCFVAFLFSKDGLVACVSLCDTGNATCPCMCHCMGSVWWYRLGRANMLRPWFQLFTTQLLVLPVCARGLWTTKTRETRAHGRG